MTFYINYGLFVRNFIKPWRGRGKKGLCMTRTDKLLVVKRYLVYYKAVDGSGKDRFRAFAR